jgi:hypothetical protein
MSIRIARDVAFGARSAICRHSAAQRRASEISARPVKAFHITADDRIAARDENDWSRIDYTMQGRSYSSALYDNRPYLERGEFARHFKHAIETTSPTRLDDEILAFSIAEGLKSLPKCVEVCVTFGSF